MKQYVNLAGYKDYKVEVSTNTDNIGIILTVVNVYGNNEAERQSKIEETIGSLFDGNAWVTDASETEQEKN